MFAELQDVGIYSKGRSDLILKDNEILIRSAKTKESEAPVEDLATAPQEAKAEAATPTVEAARPVITAPLIQTKVRTPIDSMAKYTEHKIKAALGSDESKLYVTAADDFATNGIGFNSILPR